MTQCPNCSKKISVTEDNYGTLYRCEHCQTEFFIGFDGVPENSKEPLVGGDELPSESKVVEFVLPSTPLSLSGENEEPNKSLNSADLFHITSAEPDGKKDSDIFSLNSPAPDPAQEMSTVSSNQSQIKESAPSGAFQSFTQDVQDFGNEFVGSGILSFDIEISGIDLGDTKRDLLEALEDKRFGWNLLELNQNIKDGTLTIKGLTAPKAIVLVKRIASLGLNLNWRHHVSTQ